MTPHQFNQTGRSRIAVALFLLTAVVTMPGMMCEPQPIVGGDPNNTGDPAGVAGPGNSGVTGKYVGSERCSQCHANYHTDWLGTLHSRALETLEAIGQASNSACLGCHTVGFGEEGGFVDRATTNVLAGVGCESCHGPGGDHASNVNIEELRPPIDISAAVCAKCHQGAHHPTSEQWAETLHARVDEHVAESFAAGTSLNSCGTCHSGDFRYMAFVRGESVADDYLKDVPHEEMNAITCVICHTPHKRTGNAPFADEGRDYQLRYREVAYPVPSNTVADATNPERFNLCGQCHHSRGRKWTDTSRGPHHSLQANVFVGEMPVPDDTDPLVPSMNSPHALVTEQCATCHMYRQDFQSEQAPAISGHTFAVNYNGCMGQFGGVGCHPSPGNAEALALGLKTGFVLPGLDAIEAALGDWAMTNFQDVNYWKYTSDGGPSSSGQALIPDNIKKARFLWHYAHNDGSSGVHNPDYVKAMINEAMNQLGI